MSVKFELSCTVSILELKMQLMCSEERLSTFNMQNKRVRGHTLENIKITHLSTIKSLS